MPRPNKKPEVSRSVTEEVATPEVAPLIPVQEISEPPATTPVGGPKRYKSPTTGFTIEDF